MIYTYISNINAFHVYCFLLVANTFFRMKEFSMFIDSMGYLRRRSYPTVSSTHIHAEVFGLYFADDYSLSYFDHWDGNIAHF